MFLYFVSLCKKVSQEKMMGRRKNDDQKFSSLAVIIPYKYGVFLTSIMVCDIYEQKRGVRSLSIWVMNCLPNMMICHCRSKGKVTNMTSFIQ